MLELCKSFKRDMTQEATKPEPSMFDLPEWTGVYPEASAQPQVAEAERQLVGVRFQPVGKVYHYDATGFSQLKVKDWVIVDTARGRQMGQVATLNPPKGVGGPYKRIERLATGRDMAMRHYYENKELEAMIACRAENAALRLPIKIAKAEYSFDGATLTFLYATEEEDRIETNELRDVMSRLYRAKIEMRQISPREVAKIVGGMGACGIESRCCSRFLTEFSPISIKHAKEQNLSLNPHDITGMCGRLRCCLVYEFEQYVEAKRTLPKVKSIVGSPKGEGKVVEVNPMRDTVILQFKDADGNKSEVEFHREQIVPLEEWKRLQEKASSGTCDKHEGGGCDCGKDKKADDGRRTTDDRTSAAAQAFIQANEARQAEADAKARAEAVRERIQKRRDERDARRNAAKNRRNANTNGDADAPTNEQNEQNERGERGERGNGGSVNRPAPSGPPNNPPNRSPLTPEEQKARDERRRQKEAERRARRDQRRSERPQTTTGEGEAQGENEADASSSNDERSTTSRTNGGSQQQRRPLRKPLQRRPPNTNAPTGNNNEGASDAT